MTCSYSPQVAAWLIAQDDAPMADHVKTCGACAALLQEYKVMVGHMAHGSYDDPALVAQIMRQVRQPKPERQRHAGLRWQWLFAPGCALVLAVSGGLWRYHAADSASAFTARSITPADPRAQLVGLRVMHTGKTAAWVPATETLSRHDTLSFGLVNMPGSPYRYVMVLGADATGEVFWYYPDHVAGKSVALPTQAGTQAMGESIVQDAAGAWLRVFAIFSQQPLSAQWVAQQVQQAESHGGLEQVDRLPLSDVGQHSMLLRLQD